MRHTLRQAAAVGLLSLTAALVPLPAWAADDGSIEIGVTIVPRPANGLVETGVDPAGALWLAAACLAIGALAMAPQRRGSLRAERPGSPRS